MNYGDWPPTLSFASYIAIAKFSLRRNAKSVLQPRACASVWQSVRLIILSFKKLSIISDRELLSGSLCLFPRNLQVLVWVVSRAVASGGAAVPDPPFEIGAPPISRLAHRLLHTSNIVFLKCGPPFWFLAPPSGFWPPCS